MVFVGLGLVMGAGIAYLTVDVPTINTRHGGALPALEQSEQSADGTIGVAVVGDGVQNPGDYRLASDSQIIDLINRAGGLRTGAITDGINWRATLYEGLRLTIPTRETIRRVQTGDSTLRGEDLIRFRHYKPTGGDTEYVNINDAPANELQSLPGIGDVLARRIIQYRREQGQFDQKDDLRDVIGIGKITFQELRAKIELR